MSDDEVRETAKALAVEAVRSHLELSDKTRVKTSIGTAVAICATIVGATWAASWGIQTYLHSIEDGQSAIVKALEYKVPQQQLASWAYALQNANRPVPASGLVVPDPAQFRPAENKSDK